jgi:plasmid rolling circle replication initiator protein Rep
VGKKKTPTRCAERRRSFNMQNNNITLDYKSQVAKTLSRVAIKKSFNNVVIDWLESHGDQRRAENIRECATQIGFTNIDNIARIIHGNFCRERLCYVCAWRRSAKFTAQTMPIMQILDADGYEFIFATVTVENVPLRELKKVVNEMLRGYDLLLKRRQVKRAWKGKIRGFEITYNPVEQTFHPHIHILVAVTPDYFKSEDYITTAHLSQIWGECVNRYNPICDIRKAKAHSRNGKKGTGAVVETLKYSFKMFKDATAIEGFYTALLGRRLISFSGVFAEVRKALKMSDFENILTDDIDQEKGRKIFYDVYNFDATGGVYKFYKQFEKS